MIHYNSTWEKGENSFLRGRVTVEIDYHQTVVEMQIFKIVFCMFFLIFDFRLFDSLFHCVSCEVTDFLFQKNIFLEMDNCHP